MKKRRTGKLALKIILGTVGGLFLAIGMKDLLLAHLPPELSSPAILALIGFVILLYVAMIKTR